MGRTRLLAPAAALALLAGCAGDAPPPAPPAAPPVTVAAPLVRPIVDWDEYVGRFEAVRAVEVRPRVSGQIASVHFRDGAMVRRGDLLFRIDPRPFEAALAEARASEQRALAAARLARENNGRTVMLRKGDAASREEADTARAALAQALAEVETARAQARSRALDLEFASVRAPETGRVSDRRLDPGNWVSAGDTLLTTIVSVDPIHFVFTGAESLYLKYTRQDAEGTRPSSRVVANPVEIRLQDETGYSHRGRMDFVDNALDGASGTIRGRAVVPNPDGFLTPGLFGHLRLLGSGSYDGMLVPEAALVTDQSRRVLLVVGPGDLVAARPVVLGPIVEGLRVVRSGVGASDRVIIDGVQRVRPGMKVAPSAGRIVPPAPGTGPDLTVLPPPQPAASTPADKAR
jgi:RND family efflux transporter MFP subunit